MLKLDYLGVKPSSAVPSWLWISGLALWLGGKESASQCRRHKRRGSDPSRKWEPTLVFLPGKSHGQRRHQELDATEHKHVILGTLLKSSFFVWYLFHILFSIFLTPILFCIMYKNMECFKNFHVILAQAP